MLPRRVSRGPDVGVTSGHKDIAINKNSTIKWRFDDTFDINSDDFRSIVLHELVTLWNSLTHETIRFRDVLLNING